MTALLNRLLTTNDTLVSLMLNGPRFAEKAVAFGTSVLPRNHWNLYGNAPLIPLTVNVALPFSGTVIDVGVMVVTAAGPVGKVKNCAGATSVLAGAVPDGSLTRSRKAISAPSPPPPSLNNSSR